jgi:hypothetical protein
MLLSERGVQINWLSTGNCAIDDVTLGVGDRENELGESN